MNNKYKMLLILILSFTMILGGVASASNLLFYDVTTETSYNSPITDTKLEELITAYDAGHELAKMVGGKLVNYNDYRAMVIKVIVDALADDKSESEAVVLLESELPNIIANLPEVRIDPPVAEEFEVLSINSITTKIANYDNWVEFEEQNNIPLSEEWTVEFSGDVTKDKIDGIVIEKGDEFIPVTIEITGKREATVTPVKTYEPNSQYRLKIFLTNENRYQMNFNTMSQKDLIGKADLPFTISGDNDMSITFNDYKATDSEIIFNVTVTNHSLVWDEGDAWFTEIYDGKSNLKKVYNRDDLSISYLRDGQSLTGNITFEGLSHNTNTFRLYGRLIQFDAPSSIYSADYIINFKVE